MTIQEKAQRLADLLEEAKRPDGTSFVRWRTGLPDDLTEATAKLTLAVHENGEWLPDDWRYEFMQQCLYRIAECEDLDEAYAELEPDVFNSHLLKWLSSDVRRVGYVDGARKEFGHSDQLMTEIGMGQLAELQEVFSIVRLWLNNWDGGK